MVGLEQLFLLTNGLNDLSAFLCINSTNLSEKFCVDVAGECL